VDTNFLESAGKHIGAPSSIILNGVAGAATATPFWRVSLSGSYPQGCAVKLSNPGFRAKTNHKNPAARRQRREQPACFGKAAPNRITAMMGDRKYRWTFRVAACDA